MVYLIFEEVWERIHQATDLKNLNQLAKILGVKQPAMSRAKKEGRFPLKWAIYISNLYVFNPDWVLYGKGPKHYGLLGIDLNAYKIEELSDALNNAASSSSTEMCGYWFEIADKLREELNPDTLLPIHEKAGLADARILELEDEIKILKSENCRLIETLNYNFGCLTDLHEWCVEITKEDPEREVWLKLELTDKLPLFNEWLKKRDQAKAKTGDRRAA